MQSGDGRDTQRGDDADAGGKTIDAVDQIERVSGGDQPQNRDRDVERVVGQKVEMRPPPYEDADRGQFQNQLVARLQIDDVVEQSDQAHRDRKAREPRDTVIGQARHDSDESDRGNEAGHHGQSTEQSGRLFVRAIGGRMREDAEVERGGFCDRHHRGRDEERRDKGKGYFKLGGQCWS